MTTERRRERSYSNTSPDRVWDDLVIGSGMGGMTCAAILSKIGRRVLILEQHYIPGGFTQTFKRGKYIWDVGVHVVGQTTEHTVAGRLLAELTGGRLRWASTGDVYDEFYFPDSFRADFPGNPRAFTAMLKEKFPGEEGAIDRYLAAVRVASRAMQKHYAAGSLPSFLSPVAGFMDRGATPYLEKTTQQVLDEITDNEKLKTVLVAQWGYYGTPPSQSAFGIHALVVDHFLWGGYYPVGGAKSIADALLKTVEDAGGWTRVRAKVEELIIENGTCVGARLVGGEEIRAKRVFSAAGGLETAGKLLPGAAEWTASVKKLGSSPAHVCLYFGFKGDIAAAGATRANKWFYETWSPEDVAWDPRDASSRAPVLYVSFPSLKDPAHNPGPEMLHTGEVVTFIDYDLFAPWKETKLMKRGEEYDAFKKDLEERMLAHFLEHMPKLRPLIDYVELSTPLSTEFYTHAAKGGIYGLEHTRERFKNPWLRPKTPMPGLFLAGSDVASGGVMGAMAGGMLATIAAEPLKVLGYLRKATRKSASAA